MTGDDGELQQLREETDPGTRAEETDDPSPDLEDEIVELLGAIEAGDVSKTLSVRDDRLTALIRGLEETDEIEDAGVALQEALGRDPDPEDVDRSEVLRLAVRLGLQEAAPEAVDTARDAYARHAADQF